MNGIDFEMMINYREARNEMRCVHHSVAVRDVSNRQPRVQNAAKDISCQYRTSEQVHLNAGSIQLRVLTTFSSRKRSVEALVNARAGGDPRRR